MKCERCGKDSRDEAYTRACGTIPSDFWDYCAHCSKNLCPACMDAGRCHENPATEQHEAYKEEDEQ